MINSPGKKQGLGKTVLRNLLNEVCCRGNCDMKFHPGISCSPPGTTQHEGSWLLALMSRECVKAKAQKSPVQLFIEAHISKLLSNSCHMQLCIYLQLPIAKCNLLYESPSIENKRVKGKCRKATVPGKTNIHVVAYPCLF